MTVENILVIGASGGIGKAIVDVFANTYPDATVYALSRGRVEFARANVNAQQLLTDNEEQIAGWCAAMTSVKFQYVVGTMGMLHGTREELPLNPEKKLEDVNQTQLLEYFRVNSVVPALWLKHLVRLVDKQASVISFISARVGSISDNRMGGWYGYRASKSALNMLLKTASIEYRRRTKHTALVSYHPGTVDTRLSKPFQGNVKQSKLFEPAFTAERLVSLLAQVDVDQGPYYLDWDSKPIPW